MRPYTTHRIGQIGEKAVAEFYTRYGHRVVKMNYRKTFGEVDVIVTKNDHLVFVEVKSVSCKTFSSLHEMQRNPGENIHDRKRARLRRTISAFFDEYPVWRGSEWQFDVAIVQVNTALSVARVDLLPDVIL